MKQYLIYLLLGWLFAPIIQFIEKFVFNDWEFLKFLGVITAVDTALGFVKAVIRKEVSSRKFSAVFHKLIIYWAAIIATHVLVHFTISNKSYPVFSFFDAVVFSAIIVREVISIFENIAAIDPGVFPPSLLRYLKQFDSLTGKEKLSNNPTEENPL